MLEIGGKFKEKTLLYNYGVIASCNLKKKKAQRRYSIAKINFMH